MTPTQHIISYKLFNDIADLPDDEQFLLNEARSVTQFAYAPYSNFQVGAFAKLANGEVVSGTNQENASYPAGICAERTLLSTASSIHPGIPVTTMAITYNNQKGKSIQPASPCGICRQSLAEHIQRFKSPIKLILSGMEGPVQVFENALDLLPFSFGANDLG